MLRLAAGRSLSDAQVQAVVHLVASSVPGLAPDGVSVVDQSGRLLSSAGGGGVAEASSKRIAVQNQLEERYRQSIATLLTPIVGAGNFTAEVHADVDFTETQATREALDRQSFVSGKSESDLLDLGGSRILTKKKEHTAHIM